MIHYTTLMDDIKSKKFKIFLQLKESTLNKDDLSLKGSIDELIRPLVNIINENQFYYTTSTCSGRTTLIEKPHGQPGIKKGSNFLFNSHDFIDQKTFDTVIRDFVTNQNEGEETCLWLKFEPFIMHVQCFDLSKAQTLLNIALEKGCRNSGVTLGKQGKFMVAIRSTSFMEVPIHCSSRFNLSNDYIKFLREECDRRLVENKIRLQSLQEALESKLRDNSSPDSDD